VDRSRIRVMKNAITGNRHNAIIRADREKKVDFMNGLPKKNKLENFRSIKSSSCGFAILMKFARTEGGFPCLLISLGELTPLSISFGEFDAPWPIVNYVSDLLKKL